MVVERIIADMEKALSEQRVQQWKEELVVNATQAVAWVKAWAAREVAAGSWCQPAGA